MNSNSFWKKLVLLTFTSILALHVQVASAADNTSTSSTVKTTSGNEECVISADDL